jgi:hypothetical protein
MDHENDVPSCHLFSVPDMTVTISQIWGFILTFTHMHSSVYTKPKAIHTSIIFFSFLSRETPDINSLSFI